MGTPRTLVIGLVILTGLLVGCRADKRHAGSMTQSQPSITSVSANQSKPSFASDPKYQKLIKELSGSKSKSTGWDKAVAPVESVGGKLKKAAAGVARKMHPKPKVIAADDPVSLSSKPAHIGVDVFHAAGRLAEHNGDAGEAIKQYRRALEADPDHVPTLISLARLYDRQNQFDQAVAQYQKAAQIAPSNATVHNDLGLCLSRHGDLKKSLIELQHAVRIDPHSKLYRNNLATVLVELGNSDEAWRQLSCVHAPAIAHYNLGYLLNSANRKDEARHQFAMAVRADDSLAVAKTMLDRLDAELGRSAPPMVATRAQVDDRKTAIFPRKVKPPHRLVSLAKARGLRRIPPPDPATPVAPEPRSPVRRAVSAPANPAPVRPPRATPSTPHPRTGSASHAASGLRFPVRPTSGFVSDDPDLDPQLPTPDVLDAPALTPADPDLLPVP